MYLLIFSETYAESGDNASLVVRSYDTISGALRGLRTVWVKPDKELLQTVGEWLDKAEAGDVLHVVPYGAVIAATGTVDNAPTLTNLRAVPVSDFMYKLEPVARAKKKK